MYHFPTGAFAIGTTGMVIVQTESVQDLKRSIQLGKKAGCRVEIIEHAADDINPVKACRDALSMSSDIEPQVKQWELEVRGRVPTLIQVSSR